MRSGGLAVAWCIVLGCSNPQPPPPAPCEAGTHRACTCGSGMPGDQVCLANHAFSECQPCAVTCGTVDCSALVQNATGKACVSNRCDYQACEAGWFDCDAMRGNGCEYRGSSCPVLVAAGQGEVRGLAVNATTVYWTAQLPDGGGAVLQVPSAGGMPVALASGQSKIFGPVIDAKYAYWVSVPSLVRVPLSGGTAEPFATGADEFSWLAIDGDSAYFTGHAVTRVLLDGGTVSTLFSGQDPGAVASDGTTVYWTDALAFEVAKAPKVGGARTVIAPAPAAPTWIAVGGDTVYFSTYRLLMAVRTDGGSLRDLAEVDSRGLALDGAWLYYLDLRAGGVLKVPVDAAADAGRSELLASGQPSPIFVAVDSTWVYWTANNGIWKALK